MNSVYQKLPVHKKGNVVALCVSRDGARFWTDRVVDAKPEEGEPPSVHRRAIVVDEKEGDPSLATGKEDVIILENLDYFDKDYVHPILENAQGQANYVMVAANTYENHAKGFNLVFLFRSHGSVEKKRAFKVFRHGIVDYSAFEDIFEACTQDYGCLVIDNQDPEHGPRLWQYRV